MDHTVLSANIPCLPFLRKRSPDGATLTEVGDIQLQLTTHLSTQRDERLSWPGWLTYSGRFTHISGHSSATGRAQDRKSSSAKDRRSTAVPRNQPRPWVDIVGYNKLWVTMMDMEYPLHLIDLLAKPYRKQLAKVKVAGKLSEWFPAKKGIRQGCVLSPYLFNILAEKVMRETLDGFLCGLLIGEQIVTNLCYADDIILLATLEAELQELVDRLDRVSHKLIQPTHQRRSGNGKRRNSVLPHTHSEWATGAGGYVPV